MKQSCFAAASKRALTTKTANLAPVFSKPAPSALAQQSIRSAFQRDIIARAGFHASTRQQILPPLPRMFPIAPRARMT
jgi:succinate dehydrogenase (ubiquinone) membrane anchor subunit